jgi:hypothetical protein
MQPAPILRVPFGIIAPVILVICAIGAYTVHNNSFDVMMILVFGVAGYFLKKCNYPLAPMVLAIVLGDKAEEAFRQSLLISRGSVTVFAPVTPAPHSPSGSHENHRHPLPSDASAHSVRALDATPARETLMTIIMFSAITPVGDGPGRSR